MTSTAERIHEPRPGPADRRSPRRAGASAVPLLDPRVGEYGAYVSRLAARDLRPRRTEPSRTRARGAVLFADLSGFTALAESMAAEGPTGPRRLAKVLNTSMGILIRTVLDHGGDITGFAGDGLTALWPARGWRELGEASVTAAMCGQAMQAALRDQREARPEAGLPSMRVGIGAGTTLSTYLGGEGRRWVHCLMGPAVTQATLAQGAADPGEVALSPAAARLVGHRADVRSRAGHPRLVRVRVPTTPFRSPPISLTPFLDEVGRSFVPAAVRSRIERGRPRRQAEVRRLSVVFLNLPDLTHAAPLEDAQRAMRAMQRAVRSAGGVVDKLMVDGKGTTLVVAFGMPPGDRRPTDPLHAVEAAFDIRADLGAQGWACSVGITTGRAFCGEIGNRRRREYTMLGAAVNRACRLMQRADGGVLVDGATARLAGRSFDLDLAPALELSGSCERVPVFEVLCRSGATSPAPGAGLVGRAAAREALEDVVRRARAGRSGWMCLEGEAGSGKTRLLEHLSEAFEHDPTVRILSTCGQAGHQLSPHHAWRSLFAELLGPGLGPLPEHPVPVDRASPVDIRVRRASIARFLAASAANAPLVLLFDDAQFLDEASWSLLDEVRRRGVPVGVVLAGRAEAFPGAWTGLRRGAGVRSVVLGPLDDDEIGAVACTSLGVRSVPAALRAMLSDGALRSPLAVEQRLEALTSERRLKRRGRRVVVTGGRAGPPGEDLAGLFRRRLRGLGPGARELLQTASVLGLRFHRDVVEATHDAGRPVPVDGRLSKLLERRFVVRDSTRGVTHGFVSEDLRRVVEDSIPASRRRALHRAAARHFASHAHGHARAAHHWRAAGEQETALPHFAVVFEQLYAVGAARSLVGLESVPELFDPAPGPGRDAAVRRLRVLAECRATLGHGPSARAAASRALAAGGRGPGDPWTAGGALRAVLAALLARGGGGASAEDLETARCLRVLAREAAARGADRQALRLGLRGLKAAPPGAAATRALLHADLAVVCASLGRERPAAQHAGAARELLHQADEPGVSVEVRTFLLPLEPARRSRTTALTRAAS